VGRDQVQGDQRVPIGIEVAPVQRHHDLWRRPDHVRHPVGEQRPHVQRGVAQQPVHLLDGMFRLAAADRGQPRADGTNGERDRVRHADHGVGDGLDLLGVEALAGHLVDERTGVRDSHQIPGHGAYDDRLTPEFTSTI
jgi:hypothetical protein